MGPQVGPTVPDEADASDARIALELSLAVAAAARALAAAPQACGACLWCGAALALTRRWCDADCRDDWARDQARNPQLGQRGRP